MKLERLGNFDNYIQKRRCMNRTWAVVNCSQRCFLCLFFHCHDNVTLRAEKNLLHAYFSRKKIRISRNKLGPVLLLRHSDSPTLHCLSTTKSSNTAKPSVNSRSDVLKCFWSLKYRILITVFCLILNQRIALYRLFYRWIYWQPTVMDEEKHHKQNQKH